jgi:hypothetical protein
MTDFTSCVGSMSEWKLVEGRMLGVQIGTLSALPRCITVSPSHL